ncbi:hypothetical protein HW115_01605 [Verrucomicrobiaceae bacterium N1E253]|uniref:Uncharacterized protein n=1 Tax=Oceaniferula marina TaxID=2748318 RepID=A0A851GAR8_9BACT|nr:hypothetical protein [Oceaniferula marina]NWK54289.1 hypothetical protein [Oceaniferula marina]
MDLPGLFDGRQKDIYYVQNGFSEGGRRIDHVIGIAVEVVLDDKVIKTVANTPSVLKIHKEKKITRVASSD